MQRKSTRLRAVQAPVDGGNISVASSLEGKLVAGVGSGREGLESSTLREEADGSTAGGDVLLDLAVGADGGGGLLDDEELPALVVLEGGVADDKGLGGEEQVWLGELRDLDAGSASAAVDVGGGERLRAGVLAQGEAKGREGSGLVGDGGGSAVAVLGGGAVLVEDVGRVLGSNTGHVEASADVDAVDVQALDGGFEIQRLVGDVDDEAEAGGQLVRRVVGHDVSGSGNSGAGKAKNSSSEEHLEKKLVVLALML